MKRRSTRFLRRWFGVLGLLLLPICTPISAGASASGGPLAWPPITNEQRPWTYWWWMASAVDQTNLVRELRTLAEAGLGGAHIIPIYGAKGWESQYIDYLSPRWIQTLEFTISKARQLSLDIDMTTGSGWCFGGPRVPDSEANALVVAEALQLVPNEPIRKQFNPAALHALVAFSPTGEPLEVRNRLSAAGLLEWVPETPGWVLYALSQRPSGQKVKRASPGGQGHMLNLLYPVAVSNHTRWFDGAFAGYSGPKPRAMYHDSYEYRADWAPDFLESFAQRRGYRLETELPAVFGTNHSDRAARVRGDYRETVSDIMVEQSLPAWVAWAHQFGSRTRNQAHGSPGNWLDLYAAADIPETEMFHTDRNRLISKFASSAAHVTGKPLVAAETGTWLAEHWTETLADMKYLLDDLFLSGVNHVVYHGNCYSPAEAPWPGWLFYASFEMNARNPIWRDVSALNAYAARCQSILQSGEPHAEVLLYWPIHDLWHSSTGGIRNLTVHSRDWFEGQPIGRAAARLWDLGYPFDYISDRQLSRAEFRQGDIALPGGRYRAVVVPTAKRLPIATLRQLLQLAKDGATVVFEDQVPDDVPGWADLEKRRAEARRLVAEAGLQEPTTSGLTAVIRHGLGRIIVGQLTQCLTRVGIRRETLHDRRGLMCVRRKTAHGTDYFLANRSTNQPFHDWLPLADLDSRAGKRSTLIMDPMTGRIGWAALRRGQGGGEAFLSLEPGASLFVRCLSQPAKRSTAATMREWPFVRSAGPTIPITGTWDIEFLYGGPELPRSVQTADLGSWTSLADTNAQRFGGTARYRLVFDAPAPTRSDAWLDLGVVAQSARVRLNERDLGTLVTPPFRVRVSDLKPAGNVLEVEVTSIAANRIRDLDRRGPPWKNFHDINFVNIGYRPFDASAWPLHACGLLGPVTLTPVIPHQPR